MFIKKAFRAIAIPGSLGFFISSAGCNIINPAEPIPSYLHVDSFNLAPNAALGSSSGKITDVYVYIDTKFQGAYPVNSSFPIIEGGSHQMQFYPGIILNGISNTRISYPFYEASIQTVDLKQGEIVKIAPQTKYYDNVVCSWCEDFENAGVALNKSPNSEAGLDLLPPGSPDVFEGLHSGTVSLDGAKIFFELISSSAFALPRSGSPVYLEMNYRCNNSFIISLIANTPSGPVPTPVLTVNPKETWNKIYIELAPAISANTDAYDFNIAIGAIKNAGVSDAKFYFDNLKLLHN